MYPALQSKKITIRQIDFEDNTYSLSPLKEIVLDAPFKESAHRVGILHPPIIKEKAADTFQIVAGRKRLVASRDLLSLTSCVCLVLPQDIPELDLFAIILEEIKSTRTPTALEQAFFLQKVSNFLSEKEIVEKILPGLGLSQNSYHIVQAIKLLDLEEPILLGMYSGTLHERVAREMITLSFRDRMSLFEIIVYLHLSSSNQVKFLNTCRDIAARNNKEIAEFLDDEEFKQILHHKKSNPPQKTANIMSWLSAKKNPLYTETEKNFNQLITSLDLPKHITVAHTPFFENDMTTLTITFSDLEQFRKEWQKIEEVLINDKN
jgi:ParB-like chromosome segregation protein Spo0J